MLDHDVLQEHDAEQSLRESIFQARTDQDQVLKIFVLQFLIVSQVCVVVWDEIVVFYTLMRTQFVLVP